MYYLIDDALGSVRAVTTPSPVTTVFSTDYKPYGQNYGLSQSLSVLNFEYTHKPYDSVTGLYYYGARFYDPSISRFITEDSTKGSLESPVTLNRYAYANDNPVTITDPSGHSGWWSSVTNALSNVSCAITSGATLISNVWNSLPPSEQADLATAGIDLTAGAAVAADAVTCGAVTPLVDPLVGAAISSTIYTVSSGKNARWQGVVGAAAAGAVTFGVGSAVAGAAAEGIMGPGTALALNEGATTGGYVLETDIDAGLSGKSPQLNFADMGVDMAIAVIPFLGNAPGATQMEPANSLGDYGNLYAASSNLPLAAGEQAFSCGVSTLISRFLDRDLTYLGGT